MQTSSFRADAWREEPVATLSFEEQSRTVHRWVRSTYLTLGVLGLIGIASTLATIASFMYIDPAVGFASLRDHLGLRLSVGLPSVFIAIYTLRLFYNYWEGPADMTLAEHILADFNR